MNTIITIFRDAYHRQDGLLLSQTLVPTPSPRDPNTNILLDLRPRAVEESLRSGLLYHGGLGLEKPEATAWIDVYSALWRALCEILRSDDFAPHPLPPPAASSASASSWRGKQAGADHDGSAGRIFDAWKDVGNQLVRGYAAGHFAAWTLPCLYVVARYLRVFAIRADQAARVREGDITYNEGFQDDVVSAVGKNENLQDAARMVNRIFGLCSSDRAPLEESRKWGLYYVSNLLFKIYFRLNSVSLSKTLFRSLEASRKDMPPFEAFPKSQRVTFNYYAGVIHFLDEDYPKAEEYLTQAWKQCHVKAQKNRELILTYLIPCHLLTSHKLPTASFLAQFPRLAASFSPLASAIKRASLSSFESALASAEPLFVRRRIYLTLERGHDIVLRNLLRKVFVAGGFEPPREGQKDLVRRTRVPIDEFVAAVRLSRREESVDRDEVECMLANMIYKGLLKGYIHRERGIVVLSKGNAFPGTGV